MTALVNLLLRNDDLICHTAAKTLRRICEKGHAGVVVEKGAVTALVKLLSRNDDRVRSSAACALCRICEKGHAGVVVEKGAWPALVNLLSHDVELEVRIHASNALLLICKSVEDVDDVIGRDQFEKYLVPIVSAEADAVRDAYADNLQRRTDQLRELARTQPGTPMQLDGVQENEGQTVVNGPHSPARTEQSHAPVRNMAIRGVNRVRILERRAAFQARGDVRQRPPR